ILAKADLFFARIRRSQDWSLLPYAIDLMTAGVAMSREKSKLTWVKMKFPERIRLRSKIMKEKDIQDSVTRKIASKCHTSTYEAKRCFVPYIKQILNSKSNDAWKVASWLDLDDEMINRILRTSAE
ncbi:MAG: hypothetical protein QXK72_07680, partial [Candidatus Bathyarchaeia archaeon]